MTLENNLERHTESMFKVNHYSAHETSGAFLGSDPPDVSPKCPRRLSTEKVFTNLILEDIELLNVENDDEDVQKWKRPQHSAIKHESTLNSHHELPVRIVNHLVREGSDTLADSDPEAPRIPLRLSTEATFPSILDSAIFEGFDNVDENLMASKRLETAYESGSFNTWDDSNSSIPSSQIVRPSNDNSLSVSQHLKEERSGMLSQSDPDVIPRHPERLLTNSVMVASFGSDDLDSQNDFGSMKSFQDKSTKPNRSIPMKRVSEIEIVEGVRAQDILLHSSHHRDHLTQEDSGILENSDPDPDLSPRCPQRLATMETFSSMMNSAVFQGLDNEDEDAAVSTRQNLLSTTYESGSFNTMDDSNSSFSDIKNVKPWVNDLIIASRHSKLEQRSTHAEKDPAVLAKRLPKSSLRVYSEELDYNFQKDEGNASSLPKETLGLMATIKMKFESKIEIGTHGSSSPNNTSNIPSGMPNKRDKNANMNHFSSFEEASTLDQNTNLSGTDAADKNLRLTLSTMHMDENDTSLASNPQLTQDEMQSGDLVRSPRVKSRPPTQPRKRSTVRISTSSRRPTSIDSAEFNSSFMSSCTFEGFNYDSNEEDFDDGNENPNATSAFAPQPSVTLAISGFDQHKIDICENEGKTPTLPQRRSTLKDL